MRGQECVESSDINLKYKAWRRFGVEENELFELLSLRAPPKNVKRAQKCEVELWRKVMAGDTENFISILDNLKK